jgi:uncharacterized repeat protein (TIGR03803 family)
MTITNWFRGRIYWMQRRATALMLVSALAPLALVVTQAARAQTYSVLYGFTGQPDGANPVASLVQDSAGNFYGTARGGGNSNACSDLIPPGCGVVFKLDASGNQTVLYNFTGPPDGANPIFGLAMDASGNLYGTAGGGGNLATCYGGCGVVFKLDPSGHETLLYSFTGGADGSGPAGVLVLDGSGNLYGTALTGGNFSGECPAVGGCGVVFKLDASGKQTVLYSFNGGGDGAGPRGVIRDVAGNLYGTTSFGGAFSEGVVFKIDASNQEKVLYSFTGRADGGSPSSALVQDPSGNLYGTTEGGGNLCGMAGCGVVFKLDTNGNESVLHSFSYTDGAFPGLATLIQDPAGNLYGATYGGGPSCVFFGCGVVFKLDPSGNETVLHNFTATEGDGGNPSAGLLLDASASLYGTTVWGGTSGLGTVFKLSASFSLSASALTPSTVSPGGSATSTISVTFESGFSGPVSLTCSVHPQPVNAPQCSVPGSIAPGTPATLTVTTVGPNADAAPFRSVRGPFFALWLPLLGLVATRVHFAPEQAKRKARISAVLLACVLVAGLFLAVACGGGRVSGVGGGGGTPAGQYTIIITGTSSASPLGNSTTTMLTVR